MTELIEVVVLFFKLILAEEKKDGFDAFVVSSLVQNHR